ncbi:MAG TPA: phosphoribosylanthranilate isomerase [Candidatus Dormibacteraeota bacterium]|nr:phosphoribosylanthranilate isomerase [Candidatus Dormibacteraeota bacterium]
MKTIQLKICGVRSAGEAKQLNELKVGYIGLNFIPTSSRCISLDMAESIMNELSHGDSKTVGLFAGHPAEVVINYAQRLGMDYVQLHGNEPADYALKLKTPVIRAIAVDPDSSAYDLIRFIDSYPAEFFVLDRPMQGQGDIVNMKLASKIISARPDKIFLAGGLTPSNLNKVLSSLQTYPYGIDIAGGVRTSSNDLDTNKVSSCLGILNTV